MKQILKAFAISLAVLAAVILFWLLPLKLISRLVHRFGRSAPCPNSLAWLIDNPIRRRYLAPILDRVGIQPGERVLELGPGPGMFTPEAARRTGPEGRLIAVDIQPEMIARVEALLGEARLTNVETYVASAHEIPLENNSVDRAFLVTVLPEIPDQARALAELRRVLKPGGILSITEEFYDPDYPFPAETIRRLRAAGFAIDRRFGNWWIYTINARKPTILPRCLQTGGARGRPK
jgi:ubiquinone/menaquinone biosynthesis C-methylase UbiE